VLLVSQLSRKIKGDIRLGVALGGGSARGYAHIGALSVLEQYGFTPSVIAGTSFGAVIGALYATGQTPAQMKKVAEETRRRDVIPYITDFGLHKAALFSGDKLESYFESMLDGRSFSDLKRELIVVATDIDTGERVLLKEGSLAKALRASASMPGIFAPVEIAGRRLVDGGLGSPIPIDTLSSLGVDLAIGIGAGTTADESSAIKNVQNILKTDWGKKLHQRLHYPGKTHAISRLGRGLAYTANTYLSKPDHDSLQVHTNPPISWLHFHRAEQAIKAGEKALEAFIPKIQQALRGLQPLAIAGD
jgi:predicted acylesterase/phospholipase RssA